jgi:hypothetical protein
VVGSSSMSTMNIGTTNTYTAIAMPVSVSPDSAYQVLTHVYTMLEIPVVLAIAAGALLVVALGCAAGAADGVPMRLGTTSDCPT